MKIYMIKKPNPYKLDTLSPKYKSKKPQYLSSFSLEFDLIPQVLKEESKKNLLL